MEQDTIKEVVSKTLGIDPSKALDSLRRESIDEWDSFNHLMLMSELEKKLKIKFTTQEVEKVQTIKEIRALAMQKQKQ